LLAVRGLGFTDKIFIEPLPHCVIFMHEKSGFDFSKPLYQLWKWKLME